MTRLTALIEANEGAGIEEALLAAEAERDRLFKAVCFVILFDAELRSSTLFATTTLLASAMVLCPCVRARLDTATMLSEGCSIVPGPVNTNEQEFVVRLLARLTVRGCARSASEEPCEQSSF